MNIDELIPYEKNAKKHPNKQINQIVELIKATGFNQPIVIDKNKVIVVGHGRYLAAKKLGLKEIKMGVARAPKGADFIPVVSVEELSEDEVKAYRLGDNKLNESDWNMELVIDELKDLNANGFDVELTGFDNDLILEEEEKDDDIPSIKMEVDIQQGDIFLLGRHRLMCGDATKSTDYALLMQDKKAQMVFTDPPYNVDYTGGMGTHEKNGREGIMNDKMEKGAFFDFLSMACANLNAYCVGGLYICMGSSEIDTLKRAFEKNGGHWQNFIIWVKNTFTLSRSDYQHQFEPILYGYPENVVNHYFIGDRDIANVWQDIKTLKTKFDGQFTTIKTNGVTLKLKGKVEGEVMRKKQKIDIWRFDKPVKSGEHPTMKPVALVCEAIFNSSMVGDIVLDTFLGSGSTLIAAEKTNRTCYGMELDPKYVDVIIRRWEEYTGNKAEKLV